MPTKFYGCSISGCDSHHYCKSFCRKHYTRFRRTGDPLKVLKLIDASVDERFFDKVRPDPDTDCLIWIGALDRDGYGHLRIRRRKECAHRVAYERVHGLIPDGLTIDHLCSRRACVNVAHLEVVPIRDNVLRGTGISAMNAIKTHCIRGHPFDERNTYWRVQKSGRPARQCRACKTKT